MPEFQFCDMISIWLSFPTFGFSDEMLLLMFDGLYWLKFNSVIWEWMNDLAIDWYEFLSLCFDSVIDDCQRHDLNGIAHFHWILILGYGFEWLYLWKCLYDCLLLQRNMYGSWDQMSWHLSVLPVFLILFSLPFICLSHLFSMDCFLVDILYFFKLRWFCEE